MESQTEDTKTDHVAVSIRVSSPEDTEPQDDTGITSGDDVVPTPSETTVDPTTEPSQPPEASEPTETSDTDRSNTGQRSQEGHTDDQTEETQPKTAKSRESSHDSKRRRGKKDATDANGHKVTFTVTIAKAIPTELLSFGSIISLSQVDDDSSPGEGAEPRRRKRIVDAPRAQNHFHTEYRLLPDTDADAATDATDTVRTDVVTYGVAAKIYTERQDAKVLKTWSCGDLTWVAWTHNHTVSVTEDLLKKLISHQMEVRVWDTRDKLSTRARYDRPKAFKLPSAKPGEDADAAGGVKALVLGQCATYAASQPHTSYIDRPLPADTRPGTQAQGQDEGDTQHKVLPLPPASRQQRASRGPSTRASRGPPRQPSPTPSTLVTVPAGSKQGGANDASLRSYSRLGRLAGVAPPTEPQPDKRAPSTRSRTHPSTTPRGSKPPSTQPARGTHTADTDTVPTQDNLVPDTHPSPVKGSVAESEAHTSPPTARRDPGGGSRGPRKNKKQEAASQAHAERVRRDGMCCVSVQMAKLFAGVDTMSERLPHPVNSLEDMFVTVSLSGPLLSEEQRRTLNPLVVKVQSASDMPATPTPYHDLRLRCHPAYIKYKLFDEERRSIGREQDKSIYWDDINVVLAGTLSPCVLREYLQGPPLEVSVHDRDRRQQTHTLTPALFGDDLEDEKISNVGTVASRRTVHSAFSDKDRPWDPYGTARLDLSGLLLGQKVLHLSVPIHQCAAPDVLGTRDSRPDGKLVGIAGAVDGPSDQPLPAGHFLTSGASLKVKVEVAHALVSPGQLAANTEIATTEECPFTRIVYKFDYDNITLLHKLLEYVLDVNAAALDMTDMPPAVIKAALTTYKLSEEQQTSATFDLVSGFQVMDGSVHLFVLEGLRDGAVRTLWETLPPQQDSDLSILYHSDLAYSRRLYGTLDVDVCRVRLHEPLSVITRQPLLYVRDMVPQPCFNALVKLHQLTQTSRLRDAVRNDLFPSADMVLSMSKEFGVPMTEADLQDLQPRSPVESRLSRAAVHRAVSVPTRAALDHHNTEYDSRIQERAETGPSVDYHTRNKSLVREKSQLNAVERSKTSPATLKVHSGNAFNYSSQRLNSTEQAKDSLRQLLATKPDTRYTYCPDYHHSMTVVPVDVDAVRRRHTEAAQAAYKTPSGWVYPGPKTMVDSNVHPRKLHPARAEDLQQPWEDLTRLPKGKPVSRSGYPWRHREADMDLWRRPPAVFGTEEPITIHLAGELLRDERRDAANRDQEAWRDRVVVADSRAHFHRCATETELNARASNQLDRLQGLLKDPGQKHSLRRPGLALSNVPPLNVVLNPSVDTEARDLGLDTSPALHGEMDPVIKGYGPGLNDLRSWATNGNQVPTRDYEHHSFVLEKGQDFNVYHKERSSLHKRHISLLSDHEYQASLFRPAAAAATRHTTVLPDIGGRSAAPPALHAM